MPKAPSERPGKKTASTSSASSKKNSGKTAARTGAVSDKKSKNTSTARSKKKTVVDVALQPDFTASAAILDHLHEVVLSRRGSDPSISHSARLLSRGTRKIAQKFGEEAVECLIEAVAGRPRELIGESADVLYHLIVMWVDAGITPEDIWAELKRREGVSGIEEKASRPPQA
ncbi:MAG: phosphoribosyl-ATP diphosphatase [Acetobacter sp.]|jgi:phosphoribosyl-ATP pyrophosphohydrolase|nr:phosphoribosyl-ATP diphosphatase [Acetobacter sp.]MCH4060161.1 phosphoribosyl-ATP diphosphatase [Acetobacter sp.]MCH4087101.1 phosphoribosyl-ATP diphosphatase [Acetobacter sp.]MCI1292921.1 phosphoribosyl-ATP diphosphatase [Acetobacter sp.]MCI1319507.1 phosphoribosyl-ATP diphosphatase [Acetobacter sp.]